eukprot:Blabericola_migrator_1__10191@NODE_569_length_7540_cov_46_110130_g424_i0_p1_GENE_NODE_569_length_7540_cov_46_110130_g424_i0NODE_569_length_7540_cov_46_110130_g424_i0_p1_ORF_typecomplete_len828_score118_43Abhydrolase_2/PF02230_16/57Abhydrolase_2/PF02230_16/1e20Hydrolase_4/PF12146_8/4e02Hydrolase_4/PF12146_8/1_6e08Hydrolase_4/PF12146_8/8_6e02Abhydrolase_1/PF00561_20/7_2e07Esterase_phd/PF10503_9/5_5e02Esterase_phd/PF10503_9/7_6e06FSH1/PF03959_13/5_3e06Peptidase_S9/PF00326_21/1_6e05Abhydrolase_3/PF0
MTTAVDRKRLLQFLDAIDTLESPREDGGGRAVVRGAGAQRPKRSLKRYDLSTDQLRQIYREALKRGDGKLVHRFERRVGELQCLCFQNSHAPRVAIIFFHGFDGSPYDFYYPVRRFFDMLGDRIPSVWVLPAGPERSRNISSMMVDQSSMPCSSPPTTPTVEVTEIKTPNQYNKYVVQSPFGGNPTVREVTGDQLLRQRMIAALDDLNASSDGPEPPIDPSGGYLWWEIPAIQVINGNRRSLRTFVQALKQNLRTPKTFFALRAKVLDTIQSVGHSWAIPLSQVYIGGFSQGAMLASDLLISAPANVAGVILLSGALIGRSDHKQAQREAQALVSSRNALAASLEQHRNLPTTVAPRNLNESRFQVPIFQSHGLKDPLIPFPIGKCLRKHLVNLGFTHLEFETFAGGHDFPIEIGAKVFQWLLTTPPIRALANRRGIGEMALDFSGFGGNRDGSHSRSRRHSHGSQGPAEGGKRRLSRFFDKLRVRQRAPKPVSVAMSGENFSGGCDYSDAGNSEDLLTPPSGGASSPPSSRRRGTASLSFGNSGEYDPHGNDDEVDFDWGHLTARASRAVAEKFLTVNNFTDLQILPPLEEGQQRSISGSDTSSMMPPRGLFRQMSILQSDDVDVTDWTALHQQFVSEYGDDDVTLEDCLSPGPSSTPPNTRSSINVETPSTLCSSPAPGGILSSRSHASARSGPSHHFRRKADSQEGNHLTPAYPGSRFADWQTAPSPPLEPLQRRYPYYAPETSPWKQSYETLSSWCDGSPTDLLEGDDVFNRHDSFGPTFLQSDPTIVVPKNALKKKDRKSRFNIRRESHNRKSRSASQSSRR